MDATRKLAKSADQMETSAGKMEDSADRRTQLASDRTVLAAERTYAAWVRTGLAALASGVGAKKLLGGLIPDWLIVAVGTVLVLFAAFSFAAAVWRDLDPGQPRPRGDARRLPAVLLVAINGFLVLVALAVMVGVWLGRSGTG